MEIEKKKDWHRCFILAFQRFSFNQKCFMFTRDILECKNCGIIYRSRQYWYGNPDVENVVHEEVAHVWPEVSYSVKKQNASLLGR